MDPNNIQYEEVCYCGHVREDYNLDTHFHECKAEGCTCTYFDLDEIESVGRFEEIEEA